MLLLRAPQLQSLAHLLVRTMEVDEGAVGLPPTSPVSREDDNLLSSNDAAGVEVDLAHLTILSPSGQDGEGEEAFVTEVPPPLEEV